MTISMTTKQAKQLKRILSWVIHNRNIDPMTVEDAKGLYHLLPHTPLMEKE